MFESHVVYCVNLRKEIKLKKKKKKKGNGKLPTVKMINIGTEQFDQGLHSLPFHLHLLHAVLH